MTSSIVCERPRLRRWRQADRLQMAAMNTDARLMEFFPNLLTIVKSDVLVNRINTHSEDNGFGMWAVEEKQRGSFIGFTGLAIPRLKAHVTPCAEISWRRDAVHWGRGYATESARAALEFAFDCLSLDEVAAMTSVGNVRSR